MKIIPLKVEYHLEILKHEMKSIVTHKNGKREITFYFDEKTVTKSVLDDSMTLSDDECIVKLVDLYCEKNVNLYSDIFNNHTDKVFLISKEIEAIIENFEMTFEAKIRAEKNAYSFQLSINEGKDVLSGHFESSNFSEILEKMRLYLSTLSGIGEQMTENIDNLSKDKVREAIQWK